jgi:uncharacterized protein YggE
MMPTPVIPKGVDSHKPAIAALVLGLALIGSAWPARAQYYPFPAGGPGSTENIEGITVAGKGSVAAKPNLFEIDLEVSAASELTADAIVKYRDAKRRIQDAFTALKLDNVAVEERGILVDQKGIMPSPYYMSGMPNPRTKTEVQLTRKLVVKGSNLRKSDETGVLQLIGKLLDVAQDAGARVGGQNDPNNYYYYRYSSNPMALVRFVLDDFDKLQEEAYEKAIADARARAQRLARLSQVELGPIVAIRELAVPGERTSNLNASPYPYSTSDDEVPRKRLETPKYQEIPVRVELLVRFQVHSPSQGKGQVGAR